MCVACNSQWGQEMAIYSCRWKSSDERVKNDSCHCGICCFKTDKYQANTKQRLTDSGSWPKIQRFLWGRQRQLTLCKSVMYVQRDNATDLLETHLWNHGSYPKTMNCVLPFCYEWKAAVSWSIIVTLENISDSWYTLHTHKVNKHFITHCFFLYLIRLFALIHSGFHSCSIMLK